MKLSGFIQKSLTALSVGALFLSVPVLVPHSARATEIPAQLQDVGIDEKSGAQVSIRDLVFRDETGAEVRLDRYFGGKKPVILSLVYYQCPNLCNFLLNGLVDSMKPLAWTPGQKFEIVSISIDPRETPALAAAKKEAYLRSYGRPEASSGWHFLTGTQDQISRVAREVGFKFKYDEKEKQFAHGAALFLLTPGGKLSRTLYGISWQEKELRLALLEASDGKIGTVIDRIVLFCYRYNPDTRKYSLTLMKVMQAGGAGTVLVFGAFLMVFWRKQRRNGKGS